MPAPSILLLGASGYLGVPLLAEFLTHRSKFSRLAILTDESRKHKFEDAKAKGVELIIGSYLEPDSFKGFNTVLSLLGNHAMADQPSIIKACLAAKVTEFYPSEFGGDSSQGPYVTNRYFDEKNKTRAFLAETVAKNPDSGFNYTLIMCGGFMEYVMNPIFGGDEESETFTFYGSGEKREPFTSVADVCRYTVASTLMPKSPSGARSFKIPEAWYTWSEVISTISRASGVEYKPIFLPNEEAVEKAKQFKESGDADGELTFSLKALIGSLGFEAVPEPWDNDKFPEIVPVNLETALKQYFAKSKPEV
ncbi:NAD(P)-binding Rossmann-fold containing protein [Glarea lozoyensis ATCC 20868]|uniref:NAD(P)-binding Rossmann-fold containing protein n=1 Tax=Glarea lozoyensis (strain ATCC 20868 / MF5171) TaxID=1116229 RepID=S3DWZ1_GLAL2|nr:NAD(P)-binding Rossmann-fold containing protein [Glarea lozoyensis ATCC 20868]EPE36471.1 NAD(P)-binding Rossmann-fold containing protein [Glarea lozoyensis ATCC 20868]